MEKDTGATYSIIQYARGDDDSAFHYALHRSSGDG